MAACAVGAAPALLAEALRTGGVAAALASADLFASGAQLPTFVAAGAVGGLLSGLVGVGGAVILLPLLTALTGMTMKEASNVTIVQVVAAGIVGAVTYYRRRLIHVRLALVMGGASLAGGLLGGLASAALPAAVADAVFLLVVCAAIALLFSPTIEGVSEAAMPYVDPLLASGIGLGVGGLAGILGAGGGFLIVPLLIGVLRLPTRVAIGTSPAVILLGSTAALAGKMASRQVNFLPALALVIGAVPLTYAGARLSNRLSPRALRLVLGVLLVGIALRGGLQLVMPSLP